LLVLVDIVIIVKIKEVVMVLYIVHNKSNGLTKIGITEDLKRRINQIDHSCGTRVDLVSWAAIDHAEAMEKFLHATFDAYRLPYALADSLRYTRRLRRLVEPSD
jgi:hypothetical protein